jgi:hypothetical protein
MAEMKALIVLKRYALEAIQSGEPKGYARVRIEKTAV